MVLCVICDLNKHKYENFFTRHTDIKLCATIDEVTKSKNFNQFVCIYISTFEDISVPNLSTQSFQTIEQRYLNIFNNAYSKDKSLKILFFNNTYLLSQFMYDKCTEGPIKISTPNFIKYIKRHLIIQERCASILQKTSIPTISITDFLYNFTPANILKIKAFTQMQFNYLQKYNSLTPRHNLISNWETFFNALSITNYAKYLK
jgi:hypothetical protein